MPDTCSLMFLFAVAPQVVDVFVSRLVYISYSSVILFVLQLRLTI